MRAHEVSDFLLINIGKPLLTEKERGQALWDIAIYADSSGMRWERNRMPNSGQRKRRRGGG